MNSVYQVVDLNWQFFIWIQKKLSDFYDNLTIFTMIANKYNTMFEKITFKTSYENEVINYIIMLITILIKGNFIFQIEFNKSWINLYMITTHWLVDIWLTLST
jgi:hypothetical protein